MLTLEGPSFAAGIPCGDFVSIASHLGVASRDVGFPAEPYCWNATRTSDRESMSDLASLAATKLLPHDGSKIAGK
jgi:hypothetical protein